MTTETFVSQAARDDGRFFGRITDNDTGFTYTIRADEDYVVITTGGSSSILHRSASAAFGQMIIEAGKSGEES